MDNAIKNGKHWLSVKASLSGFLGGAADEKSQPLLMDSGVAAGAGTINLDAFVWGMAARGASVGAGEVQQSAKLERPQRGTDKRCGTAKAVDVDQVVVVLVLGAAKK